MTSNNRIFLSLCISCNIFSSVTFVGNGTGSTFTVPVGNHAMTYFFETNPKRALFYTTASTASAGNTYAVARLDTALTSFQPLAPETIKIGSSTTEAANPLYGAQIDYLTLNSDKPVVVKHGETRVIAYDGSLDASKYRLLISDNLVDAAGLATSQIIGLGRGALLNFFIAPVLNNAGDLFGATGSGVALLQAGTTLSVLNAEPTSAASGQLAAKLDNTSEAFAIGSSVSILSNAIDVHYDEGLNRFYIAVQVQANAAASSGARAIVVGYIYNNGDGSYKLAFKEIVPSAALLGFQNNIIGTGVSSDTVSIIKVRTLETSTRLNYLIALGGNGTASTVGNTIYAMPLVDNPSNTATHGTLAAVGQTPTDYFNNGVLFSGRAFTQPATTHADLFTDTDQAAIVGSEPLPLLASQSVADIFAYRDTVFASIAYDYAAGTQPGVFYSKALFDDLGRIKSWTPWARAAGTDDLVYGLGVDIFKGNIITITNGGLNVNGTTWSQGDSTGIEETLGKQFPIEEGGLQNFLDFPQTTTAFSNFSMLIATGLRHIALVESGNVQDGFFKYTRGDFLNNIVSFDSGTIGTIPVGTKIVSLKNGSLITLKSVAAAEVATKVGSDMSWFFFGGVGGLAVLCDADGNGITGTISALSDIPAGLGLTTIGNFSFVQKIISDGTYLYVLTIDGFYRVAMNATDFKNNTLSTTRLASAEQFGSFADAVISGPLAVLATGAGLIRIGNGKDVATITSETDAQWTLVTVPGAVGPILRLLPFSTTNDLQEFAVNGQLHVLCAYIGYNLSTVNRFAVALNAGAVDDTILQPLPDLFVKNTLSYIIDFSAFRNTYNDTWSFNYGTVSKDVNNLNRDGELKDPRAEILRPDIQSGSVLSFVDAVNLINFSSTASIINTPLFLRSASGSTFVAGDFGVYVNE